MTSVKYDHLQIMQTITGKFHQNPLKNVGVTKNPNLKTNKLVFLEGGSELLRGCGLYTEIFKGA